MFTQTSLCFLAIVASATAISISGLASLDANAFEAQGKLAFPRIPGINIPLFSPSRLTAVSSEDNQSVDVFDGSGVITNARPAQFFFHGHDKFAYSYSDLSNIIPVPNITALLVSRNITNTTNVIILPLSPLQNVNKLFPGLDFALYHARKNLAAALNTTGDVTIGIQNALQQAFMTNDPAAAINTLIRTILGIYGAAIRNCPFPFVSTKLAAEAASLVRSVINAITTAAIIPASN